MPWVLGLASAAAAATAGTRAGLGWRRHPTARASPSHSASSPASSRTWTWKSSGHERGSKRGQGPDYERGSRPGWMPDCYCRCHDWSWLSLCSRRPCPLLRQHHRRRSCPASRRSQLEMRWHCRRCRRRRHRHHHQHTAAPPPLPSGDLRVPSFWIPSSTVLRRWAIRRFGDSRRLRLASTSHGRRFEWCPWCCEVVRLQRHVF
mmetsp:Transcript_15993/g.29090  ORF Transcript_15993/g.29090 Transcript_15993/m.29090 type:complete len:204 (-) Transcript_15993:358-969(-)